MAEFVYFRYILAVIGFYCMLVVNLTRSDFNVTILQMINNSDNCTANNSANGTVYCWSKEIEELLVSSYFIGYMFQLPGGLLANIYGAYYVCGLGMLVTIVLTFVTPTAAGDWRILFAVRLVQGLGAASTLPAMSALWTKWAPKHEKSTLFSITVAGHFIGSAVGDVLSGALCDQGSMFGGYWPSVFRIFGIIGILWVVLWVTFASSDPEHSIWASLDEKDYINMNRDPLRRNSSIPWLWILTSTKCWAIYFCHICSYFGYLTMIVGYPQYFKDVHNLSIKKLGFYSAIPIMAMFVTSILAAIVTDMILERNLVSVTAMRKINTAIGMYIPAALNFVLAFYPNLSLWAVIVVMSVQNAANGFVLSGFQVNYIDINPDHAGMTTGVGNSLASAAGVIIPILLYRYNMQPKHLDALDGGSAEWKNMFMSVGAVMSIGATVYCIVGTGKRQLEGMEGYVEIAGTDSGAEQTTHRPSTAQYSSSVLVSVPDETISAPEAPSRASIDWSEEDAVTEHISSVQDFVSCLKIDEESVEAARDLIKFDDPIGTDDAQGTSEKMGGDEEEKDDKDTPEANDEEAKKTCKVSELVRAYEVNELNQSTVAERRGIEITPVPLVSAEESREPTLDRSPEIKPAEEIEKTQQISGQASKATGSPDQVLVHREIAGEVPTEGEAPIKGEVLRDEIRLAPPARRYSLQPAHTDTRKERGEMAEGSGKQRSQSNASQFPPYDKPHKVLPVPDFHNSDEDIDKSDAETEVCTEEMESSEVESYDEDGRSSETKTNSPVADTGDCENDTAKFVEIDLTNGNKNDAVDDEELEEPRSFSYSINSMLANMR